MKKIVILGSTGSIGRSTLEVLRNLGPDYAVHALAARSQIETLAGQVREWAPRRVAVPDCETLTRLRRELPDASAELSCGEEALERLARDPEAGVVVNALVGGAGLRATIAALEAGKVVALANKESIVMAGRLVAETAARHGGTVLPVDSEHSAVHQCLRGEDPARIGCLLLTASGGPFLRREADSFARVTPEEALRHPNWLMGPKITVDSATLMNKGLEVIEAHYLFDLPPEKIGVVIHPQSVVHSLVEFVDGSLKAQLSLPDMRIPIQYALTYPDRLPARFVATDLVRIGALEFEEPDLGRFPCLELAYEALRRGEGYPAVLSTANEIAVEAFLQGDLAFDRIPWLIEQAMDACRPGTMNDLESVLLLDDWTRKFCVRLLQR
ncbi:MAG: 1-deoxy-D-xylulose-5-phosphate reductoisomerase [Candidatus Zixiibacteriota bacterium]|nr:MAG: 1-deoxy-D-xylulose-5-phosphate reductoisomerase [candidate division Zixibacteria bacterium]